MQTALEFIATLDDISDAALDALDASGVAGLPVVWNSRLRSTAGRCCYKRRDRTSPFEASRLELNPTLRQEGPEALREAFLHELAHAIAGHAVNHGAAWKRIHRLLGGSAKRTHSFASMAAKRRPKQVVGHCEKCGEAVRRARKLPRAGYTHRNCGGVIIRS